MNYRAVAAGVVLAFQMYPYSASAQNCTPELRIMEVPDKPSREVLFARANIGDEVTNLDELDRDILYMRGRYMSFELWKSKYPNIDESKLQKLKSFLQERHCDGAPRMR